MKLTEKQRRFADEYIKTGNIRQSAIRAGYKEKTAHTTGSENLRKPYIKNYIDERLDQLKKDAIADQDEILQFLTKVVRGKASGTALVGEGLGEQRVQQVPPTVGERTRAAELLGKRYAMWTEKQEIEHTGAIAFVDDIGDDGNGTT